MEPGPWESISRISPILSRCQWYEGTRNLRVLENLWKIVLRNACTQVSAQTTGANPSGSAQGRLWGTIRHE